MNTRKPSGIHNAMTKKWEDLKKAKYKDDPKRLERVQRNVVRAVKKAKPQRLVHQTCIRFTPEQWKLVNAYAKRQKVELAAAIRESVLYFAQPTVLSTVYHSKVR